MIKTALLSLLTKIELVPLSFRLIGTNCRKADEQQVSKVVGSFGWHSGLQRPDDEHYEDVVEDLEADLEDQLYHYWRLVGSTKAKYFLDCSAAAVDDAELETRS